MPEAYIGRLLERTVFVVHEIWSGCGRDEKLGGGGEHAPGAPPPSSYTYECLKF